MTRPILLASILAAALVSMAAPARAGDAKPTSPQAVKEPAAEPAPPPGDDRMLTAAEIDHYAQGYLPAIKACYVAHGRKAKAATGALRLELVIQGDGFVLKLAVVAPGVTGKAFRRLDACVRKEVATWHFPVRLGATSAVVPFFFVRGTAKGAGPQPGCWSPRGCPGGTP